MRDKSDKDESPVAEGMYRMRLFVAGSETNSAIAKEKLARLCSAHLADKCVIEIVDIFNDYQAALDENILITPALVICKGEARAVVYGNLTDEHRAIAAIKAVGLK